MQSFIIRSATAALFAAALAPAAFAQSASRAEPASNPYAGTGRAAVCTQLELNVGLTGDECGVATLTELSKMKGDRDNTN